MGERLLAFTSQRPFKGKFFVVSENAYMFCIDRVTIEEASKYFRIGEKKLRKLAEENLDAGWVIVNGNRIQIKRKQFEKIIDTLDEI